VSLLQFPLKEEPADRIAKAIDKWCPLALSPSSLLRLFVIAAVQINQPINSADTHCS
jgi:hypothetical protein